MARTCLFAIAKTLSASMTVDGRNPAEGDSKDNRDTGCGLRRIKSSFEEHERVELKVGKEKDSIEKE